MEDKIKQSFEKISNEMKQGFDSVIALSEFNKEEDLATFIKVLQDGK